MQSTLLLDRKWHCVGNEHNWGVSHIFAAVRSWRQKAGQETSLLLTKLWKGMSSAVPFVFISLERSNNKQHKVKTINRIWRCNFAQNMKQKRYNFTVNLTFGQSNNLTQNEKEDERRRCRGEKLWFVKYEWEEGGYTYRGMIIGLAKRERDLWAEGSVAELFVYEFFCIQADCKQHSIRSD